MDMGILGFRAFFFFFCFGSIARTDLTCRLASFASIYHQTSADFTGALREGCCAGFLTPQRQKPAHRTLCAFHVRRWFFPPSSRKQSGHNCALYMVKSSFVWRKRLAARLPCKVLRPRWRCAKADKSRGNCSKFKLQRLRKFSDPITKMGVRLHY